MIVERGKEILCALDEQWLPILDSVLQFYNGNSHEERHTKYVNALRGLKPGVTEMIIHCGFDDQELKAITKSSPRRDGDRRIYQQQRPLSC